MWALAETKSYDESNTFDNWNAWAFKLAMFGFKRSSNKIGMNSLFLIRIQCHSFSYKTRTHCRTGGNCCKHVQNPSVCVWESVCILVDKGIIIGKQLLLFKRNLASDPLHQESICKCWYRCYLRCKQDQSSTCKARLQFLAKVLMV